MKAYCLVAAFGAALLSGCAVYDRTVAIQPVYSAPAAVAYSAPATVAYVSPSYYIAPSAELVLGAGSGSMIAP